MPLIPGGMVARRPLQFFPSVDELIKMQEKEKMKSETFITLVNFVNTLYTGKVETME